MENENSQPSIWTKLAVSTVVGFLVGFASHTWLGSNWWEVAGFTTGIAAIYLTSIGHIINWPLGIANVIIYGWIFYSTNLYADASLQIFYLVLSIWGWRLWAKGGGENKELPISRTPKDWYPWLLGATAVGCAVYIPLTIHFKGASPIVDSVLTVLSIVAQVLLNKKKLENWLIWIAVDVVYIPLYLSRQLYPTALLYAIYLGLAFNGLSTWKSDLIREKQDVSLEPR